MHLFIYVRQSFNMNVRPTIKLCMASWNKVHPKLLQQFRGLVNQCRMLKNTGVRICNLYQTGNYPSPSSLFVRDENKETCIKEKNRKKIMLDIRRNKKGENLSFSSCQHKLTTTRSRREICRGLENYRFYEKKSSLSL